MSTRRPGPGRRRLLRRAAGRGDHAEPAPAAARSSTRRRSAELVTRSARSVCCSRSSCGRPAPTATSWSWASGAGGPRSEAGLEPIPAIVRETGDDDLLRDALLENLHRAQLNPLEEAAAYQQLLDDFGCTHEELASRIGRVRPQISNTCGCSGCRRRSSAGSRPGCCPPATPGRCSASTTPRRRSGWPTGSSPRGSRCGRSRSSSPSVGRRPAATRTPRPRGRRPPRVSSTSPTGSPSGFETRVRVELGKAQGQGHHRVRHARRPPADRRPDRPALTIRDHRAVSAPDVVAGEPGMWSGSRDRRADPTMVKLTIRTWSRQLDHRGGSSVGASQRLAGAGRGAGARPARPPWVGVARRPTSRWRGRAGGRRRSGRRTAWSGTSAASP